jgi:hypothetical protein
MALPRVVTTIEEGRLGAISLTDDDVCTSNVPTKFAAGQVRALVAAYGYGPGTQAASLMLADGHAVVFTKLPSTTPGDEGTEGADNAVTLVGTGTSVITLTGAAYDSGQWIFLVDTGCTIGVTGGKFSYSRDGGRSYSAIISLGTATTYLIPNSNITLNFAAGTLVAGDVSTFISKEPEWAGADLAAGFAALLASSHTYSFVHLVGPCTATEGGNVKTEITAFEAANKWSSVVVDDLHQTSAQSEAVWLAARIVEWAAFTSTRVVVGAGKVAITSPIDASAYLRPVSWAAVRRAVQFDIHYDLSRVKSGPLNATIVNSVGNLIGHDERTTPGLDAARFLTATTIIGKTGVYVGNPNVMCTAGSDFTLWQYRRVMDKACEITYTVLAEQLSDHVRLDKVTGFILEKDALAIESAVNSQLRIHLIAKGRVSDAYFILSRTDDISATKTVTGETSILPLGYLKRINHTIGFVNPALKVS